MNSLRNQKICLKEFIPDKVLCNDDVNKNYDLSVLDDGIYLMFSYFTDIHNQFGKVGRKEHNLLLPKFIKRNQENFEVLGLLQAEMGKQQDGKIVFCNHEYQIINKVIKWFDKEFNFPKEKWKWYIKVNINEPLDENYKKEIEEKVINYWISKTGLSLEQSYPKKVSYIKNTTNKKLGFYDYGTLIIERKSNLFSQIIKNFVKRTTQNILNYEESEIRSFLRGIIAGESCVEIDIPSKKFRVHISSTNPDEKLIYHNCLKKLGVSSIIYNGDKLIVSKKQNNLQLLKQKLMTLSPEKYNKFLRMMNLYGKFEGLNEWRSNLQKPHNKIPQNKINKIIELHNLHPEWPAWKIAEQVGVSDIKVQRVRKERLIKNS
ncbi:LAGLIDADG family homing endonuclease [Candidatus Woesearchaeota archaeon]|nr:LAGLIDADG family homing endonuclease [Candidatus Woesearchaeota archaeon]